MARFEEANAFATEIFAADPEGVIVTACDLTSQQPYNSLWSTTIGQLIPTFAGIEYHSRIPCARKKQISSHSKAYLQAAGTIVGNAVSTTLLMFDASIADRGDVATIHAQAHDFTPPKELLCCARVGQVADDSLKRHPELELYTKELADYFSTMYGEELNQDGYDSTRTLTDNTVGFCVASLDIILALSSTPSA